MPDVTPIVNVALVLLIVFMVVMPMIRDLAIDPERGVAIVSTWTVLYSVPYLSAAEVK